MSKLFDNVPKMKPSAALIDPVFSRASFKLTGAAGADGTECRGPPSTRFWVARGAVASMGVARLSGRGGLGDAAVVVEIVGIQDGK